MAGSAYPGEVHRAGSAWTVAAPVSRPDPVAVERSGALQVDPPGSVSQGDATDHLRPPDAARDAAAGVGQAVADSPVERAALASCAASEYLEPSWSGPRPDAEWPAPVLRPPRQAAKLHYPAASAGAARIEFVPAWAQVARVSPELRRHVRSAASAGPPAIQSPRADAKAAPVVQVRILQRSPSVLQRGLPRAPQAAAVAARRARRELVVRQQERGG